MASGSWPRTGAVAAERGSAECFEEPDRRSRTGGQLLVGDTDLEDHPVAYLEYPAARAVADQVPRVQTELEAAPDVEPSRGRATGGWRGARRAARNAGSRSGRARPVRSEHAARAPGEPRSSAAVAYPARTPFGHTK